jgi:hypothetical protein
MQNSLELSKKDIILKLVAMAIFENSSKLPQEKKL